VKKGLGKSALIKEAAASFEEKSLLFPPTHVIEVHTPYQLTILDVIASFGLCIGFVLLGFALKGL
jgi:hypothetical protein